MSMKSITTRPAMSRSRSWRAISCAASRLVAVAVEAVLDDGEPQARAPAGAARRDVDPVEALREPRDVLGRYSFAVPEEVARGELRPLRNPDDDL